MAWTAPRTYVAGEVVTAAILNIDHRDNLKAIGDAWTAYTPTWTTDGTAPSLGNGTLTGAFMSAGKHTTFRLRLLAGSTTTFGTGQFRFTYPVTALTASNPDLSGYVFRSGPSYWGIIGVEFSATVFRMVGTANNSLVTSTAPVTFTNGDALVMGGTYEAA